jgi:hypothetical protein
MAKRIILGGLIGAVTVFLALSVVHMLTGLAEAGVKAMPEEDAVMAAMRSSIHEPGFYFFPGTSMSAGRTKEQQDAEQKRYQEKYEQGPNGVLIYHPGGQAFSFGKLLVNQFVLNLVEAFLAAGVLALLPVGTSYGTRVLVVVLMALFAVMGTNAEYWNWYGFPGRYTLGYSLGSVLSWVAGGLAMAPFVKR